jgi:hypothetical protein
MSLGILERSNRPSDVCCITQRQVHLELRPPSKQESGNEFWARRLKMHRTCRRTYPHTYGSLEIKL